MNNGLTSQYFSVHRSVRQGDPLRPYLFILALELLSRSIREDPNIKGILVRDKEIKIIQYADDTSCVVADEPSANNLFLLFESFGSVSSLTMNVNKSQALWLGSKRHCMDTPFNVVWPKELVNALGVFFSYDEIAAEKVNFEPRLKKLKSILNVWKMRQLTQSKYFLHWRSIISAIPVTWKNILKKGFVRNQCDSKIYSKL